MTKKEAIKLLKKIGSRITNERKIILKFLAKNKDPVSAKEILKGVKKHININQSTVYRILNKLKKNQIINEINFQENGAYFELADEKRDHHHIICIKCKKVKNFIGCNYQKIITKISKDDFGFSKIISHSFEIYGLCFFCQKK